MIKKYDILISGGSYVGLSLAIAVKIFIPYIKIIIIEKKNYNFYKDKRASTISNASAKMLNVIGCWKSLINFVQPIYKISITDSLSEEITHPIFLNFIKNSTNKFPLAYMIENKFLNRFLYNKAKNLGVIFIENMEIIDFYLNKNRIFVKLENKIILQGKLLIGADGKKSKTRDISGIKIYKKSYDQFGITFFVKHERSHFGQAIEHFFQDGPLAILPIKGNRSFIVWSILKKNYRNFFKTCNSKFEYEFKLRFGNMLGNYYIEKDYSKFSLNLLLAYEFIRNRFAIIGDAAHTIHPIIGQGLNIGLYDAAALAEIIVDSLRKGIDIGDHKTLIRYQRWRRFESTKIVFFTDILNCMFSSNNYLLRSLRGIGLRTINNIPKIKNVLIKHASGIVQKSPNLLLGNLI